MPSTNCDRECGDVTAFTGEKPDVLSLHQAIEIALANNPTLEASEASVDIMRAKIQGTRSARYPNIQSRFVLPFVGTESGVSVNQLIWDFRHTRHRIKASEERYRASEFKHIVQREDVILQTKVTYYTVLIQKLEIEAAERLLSESTKRLEQGERFL